MPNQIHSRAEFDILKRQVHSVTTKQNRPTMASELECSISEKYLVGTEDVGVVVEVTECAESVFVLLELDKAIT